MTILAGTIVTIVILVLCALGLGVGLLCGWKGLRSCGRAAADDPGGCAMCGGDAGKCDRKK
ncbi:MAG: hypothetical protein V1929_10110 [bacterium]